MKSIVLAVVLCALTSVPSQAQEEGALPPAAMEQVVMSEKLIAMGKARADAMLILAAIRIRAALDEPSVDTADTLTTRDEAIAAAREAAAGQAGILSLIDEMEGEQSRRMCIYANNGVCY
jgi:hypothetical protein